MQPTGYKYYPVTLAQFEVEFTFVRVIDDDPGNLYIPVRQLCEGLGIAHQAQLTKIRADEILGGALRELQVPTGGGTQRMACLRKQEVAAWLLQINPSRCREAIRGQLADFQRAVLDAADRLLFGDLSPVTEGGRALAIRPQGALHLPCLRCGAMHSLGMSQEKGLDWRIADEAS